MGAMLDNHSESDQLQWFNLLQAEREAAIVQERRRFADELHDVFASNLQAAMLHLEEARQSLPDRESPALGAIEAAGERIRACWADARRSAAGLRPADLDRRGLAGALAEYVQRVSEVSEIGVTFSTCGTPRALPEAAELALLRVGQEAVTNALRHAAAEAISVELAFDGDGVRLDVTDNGLGFNLHSTVPGCGLLAMRDRVGELGAELSILTEPSHGTEVIVTVPYDACAAAPPNEPDEDRAGAVGHAPQAASEQFVG